MGEREKERKKEREKEREKRRRGADVEVGGDRVR